MMNEEITDIQAVKERLQRLGLQLPTVSSPGGNYVSVNVRGKIAYVAIQFPILNGEYLFQGRLGKEVIHKILVLINFLSNQCHHPLPKFV